MIPGRRLKEGAERLVAAIAARARAPRRRELAFLAALVFGLFVYLPLRLTFGWDSASGDRLLRAARPPRVLPSDVDPKNELPLPAPPYFPVQAPDKTKRRNPFSYQAAPTRPPTPTPVPTPPPPPPPPPPPTPTPYAPPFTLFGLARTPSQRVAFLKGPDDAIIVALEGQVLAAKGADGRPMSHIVQQIGEETVTIGPTAFEASVVLRLGPGAAGGGR